jgi:hypothetical protein
VRVGVATTSGLAPVADCNSNNNDKTALPFRRSPLHITSDMALLQRGSRPLALRCVEAGFFEPPLKYSTIF